MFLLQDAANDEILQRAYRLLVNMHESCGQITTIIEDTGHTLRELEDLQDQVRINPLFEPDVNKQQLTF